MPAGRAKRGGPSSPRRILLVDDHPLVRERLAELINEQPDLRVCGEAADRHEALARLAQGPPDLAIVDLSLRNSHGLELIKDLHARDPHLPILVVSMHDEALYAERALRAGARGYINKQEATQNVLKAIRRLLAGQVYLSPQLATRLAGSTFKPERRAPSGIEQLSDRELRVFELLGQGRTLHQIAAELCLDVKTVEAYRARIRVKLGLPDARAVLQRAIDWSRGLG